MFSIVRNEILRPSNAAREIKRFRGKINIQKPKPPHFERAKYIALTQQYFKKREVKPLYETCTKHVQHSDTETEKEYPYQRMLADELLGYFNNSKLVVFYHKNPFSGDQECLAKVLFKKENMLLTGYGKKTLEMAVKGTKFEAILDFYVCHNMILFSQESNIKKMLNISRKFPPLVILAAIVEGRFINRDDLIKYGAIPDITAAQSEFVQTLNSIGGGLTSHLNSRSQTLISQLQERVNQLKEN